MARWYLHEFAVGSNNGTSWVNAWKDPQSVDWSKIRAGDVIIVSGDLLDVEIWNGRKVHSCPFCKGEWVHIPPDGRVERYDGRQGEGEIEGHPV